VLINRLQTREKGFLCLFVLGFASTFARTGSSLGCVD